MRNSALMRFNWGCFVEMEKLNINIYKDKTIQTHLFRPII